MENKRTTPQNYMTVSQVAKKTNTTVRTLQYYDKENILMPSGGRERGCRLYSNKDLVKLYQIQSMKYLGFSLADIKTQLPSLNTPEEVANLLSEKAQAIEEKINSLLDVLKSVKNLHSEVLQMKAVDWQAYADITVLLQSKNDLYCMVKHFDKKMRDHISNMDKRSAKAFLEAQQYTLDKVHELQEMGVSPKSKQGQAVAKEFWKTIMFFINGDMSLIPELYKLGKIQDGSEWKNKLPFIEEALDAYFKSCGHNPFMEVEK